MKLPRDLALKINWVLDQLIPPILRDSKWFMYLPLKMAFKHRVNVYLTFKERASNMGLEEYLQCYRETAEVAFERETDLNKKSIELIIQHVKGKKILEVGCGKGLLSEMLAVKSYDVTGVDIIVPERAKYPNLKFQVANAEQLPFADDSFDTVICTHTLEHILNFQKAVSELRRMAKRVIIVVPKQRAYKYSFDLHVNFFPYRFMLLYAMGKKDEEVICINAKGDLFYVEDKK